MSEDVTDATLDPPTVDQRIEDLLADTPHVDWLDAEAIAMQAQILEATAVMAGVSMLEALVRHAAAKGSVYLPEVNTAGDALLGLHRGLISYQRRTLRYDGLELAWRAVETKAGAGVAACVMGALERLRGDLTELMLASRPLPCHALPETNNTIND